MPAARRAGWVAAAGVSVLLAACGATRAHSGETRYAIWVTRFDYRTEADVRTAVRRCAEAGFDTVFFQVRGNGTVFYRSRLEPWAAELGGTDPGFDPLRVACEEARARGVRLHAWVNAVPGWRGERPPADLRQLYHTRPEWFLVDQHGKRQPLAKDYYVALNPCLPAVREHIAAVCAEIAANYPVEGVHLDYIRFLEKKGDRDYPRDAATLSLYRRDTGKAPDDDPAAWAAWKTRQVTTLVREIRRRVRAARPSAKLTAAVFPTPALALRVHQDWTTWVRRGWIDLVVPMVYDEDDARFRKRLSAIRSAVSPRLALVGIGAYKHRDPHMTVRQIDFAERMGFGGVSLFAYSSFWNPFAEAAEPPDVAAQRAGRRRVVLDRIGAAQRSATSLGSRRRVRRPR